MATITMRNFPEYLYQELVTAAKRNRRSLNQEIIYRWEVSLGLKPGGDDLLSARPVVERMRPE